MLTQHFDEEICDLSGLCSQAFELVPATQLQEGEDIQCEFCEKVVQHWVDVYASNSSLAGQTSLHNAQLYNTKSLFCAK